MSNFLPVKSAKIAANLSLVAVKPSPILAAKALPTSISKPTAVLEPGGLKYSCGGYSMSDPTVSVPAVRRSLAGGGATAAPPPLVVLPQALMRTAPIRVAMRDLELTVSTSLNSAPSCMGQHLRASL